MLYNNLKQKALALVLIIGTTSYSFGQFNFPEFKVANKLKTCTLAVKLFNEANSEYKPFNDAIKKVYTEEWKTCPVEFVTEEQFNNIVKTGKANYAVVYSEDVNTKYTQEYNRGSTSSYERSFNFSHYDVMLKIVDGPDKLTTVTAITFCNSDLMPGEFYFAGLQLNLLVSSSLNGITGKNFYDAEKNIEYIKSKKMFLPKELFKEKDLAKIADKYEHPHKISDYKELNDVVLAKDAEYVYPKIIWSNQHRNYGWITVSAADGSVRSFMGFTGLATGSNEKANEVLKPGQLNNALNKMMQKVNNKYD